MSDWLDAEARVEQARKLYDEGRWQEAADQLRSAIESNPYNAAWYFNLGLTLEAMEDYSAAVESFLRAIAITPDDLETLNCLGINLTRMGKYAEALDCFQQMEKLDATYEPGYCNRVVTYTEMGDHEQAEVMFYMARQVKDECPLCLYNIANSLYARGLYDRAIHCWMQALRIDPLHPEAHERIAEAYWAKGDMKMARAYYEAELRIADGGGSIETLLDFGEMLVQMGDTIAANGKFRRVLDREPDNAQALCQLAEIACVEGNYELAERRAQRLLEVCPDHRGAYAKLGKALLRQGKVQDAAKALLVEIRRVGSDSDLLHELGELLLEAHEVRRANEVLARLVELTPSDALAQHNLAVSYFMMDRLDDGIAHCRKALKIQPDYALALYNLAVAHMIKGDRARARRYAQRAMMLDPENDNFRQLIRKLGSEKTTAWKRLKDRFQGIRRIEADPAD